MTHYGWQGKILEIDLTEQKFSVLSPSVETYSANIGGRGLAGHFLCESVTRDWNDPRMPLIFMTGPLAGTLSPTPGRMTVMSRSPLTGTIADSSVGGNFAVSLKNSGWDGVIIRGAAGSLCGIEIHGSNVSFTDAEHMRGDLTSATAKKIAHLDSFAAIGPAAENGVRFANIVVDSHYFAGRNGLGLVMAAKNLKYIGICSSRCVTAVKNQAALTEARKDILRLTSASPFLSGELGLTRFGTPALFDLIHQRRMMPTANFRKTYFENSGNLNAFNWQKNYPVKSSGCKGCHIRCKKLSNKKSLPEYETLSHFSALIENRDMGTILEANSICQESGMDTISAAAAIACWYEITGTVPSPDRTIRLLTDMAAGKNDLRLGPGLLAESLGRPQAAMCVKNQALPAYDPRGSYGMALAYVTSTRGGCHLRAYPVSHEILRKPVATDRFTFSGKPGIIKIAEDQNAVIDSLTACKFIFFAATLEEYARAYTAVTGIETTAQELLKTGERIYFRERLMNTANGFSAKEDDLPDRFFTLPGTNSANLEVPPLNRSEFLAARDMYYRIRGIDKNGIPFKQKTSELELTC